MELYLKLYHILMEYQHKHTHCHTQTHTLSHTHTHTHIFYFEAQPGAVFALSRHISPRGGFLFSKPGTEAESYLACVVFSNSRWCIASACLQKNPSGPQPQNNSVFRLPTIPSSAPCISCIWNAGRWPQEKLPPYSRWHVRKNVKCLLSERT